MRTKHLPSVLRASHLPSLYRFPPLLRGILPPAPSCVKKEGDTPSSAALGGKRSGPDHRQKQGRGAARCSRAPHGGQAHSVRLSPRISRVGTIPSSHFGKDLFLPDPHFKSFSLLYTACCCQKFIQATFWMPSWCACLGSCLGYRVPPANLPKLGSTEAAERNEHRVAGESQARTPQQRGTGTSTAGSPVPPGTSGIDGRPQPPGVMGGSISLTLYVSLSLCLIDGLCVRERHLPKSPVRNHGVPHIL